MNCTHHKPTAALEKRFPANCDECGSPLKLENIQQTRPPRAEFQIEYGPCENPACDLNADPEEAHMNAGICFEGYGDLFQETLDIFTEPDSQDRENPIVPKLEGEQ